MGRPAAAACAADAAAGSVAVSDAGAASAESLLVYFVHPDLGIGGAERLVVDAAVGLQSLRRSQSPSASQSVKSGAASSSPLYRVRVLTSHHDRLHCFEETLSELSVSVYSDWLPQSLRGRGKILCAIARSLMLAVCAAWRLPAADVLVVDQLSAALPLYRLLWPRTAVLFYCHFPDLLLSSPVSLLHRLYRLPVDALEQWTMSYAAQVAVNSAFTRQVYLQTFTRLSRQRPPPLVIYPSINCARYDDAPAAGLSAADDDAAAIRALPASCCIFLSINRFERKKRIELAVDAFALLLDSGLQRRSAFASCCLILAGGFDPLNSENVEYVPELEARCRQRRLSVSRFPDTSGQVLLLLSFSATQRAALLSRCLCVLYTPEREHFGIVPVEAQYAQRPVVACDSGGPTESVEHEQTGFLCPPTAAAFSAAMQRLMLMTDEQRLSIGRRGRQRVLQRFSLSAFVDSFHTEIRKLHSDQRRRDSGGAGGAAGGQQRQRPSVLSHRLLYLLSFLLLATGVWLIMSA